MIREKLHIKRTFTKPQWVLGLLCCLFSLMSFAQVTSEVDTTKIKIGEQINYKINVEADSTALVVFPEGQTFMPLESVEALEIDTTKKDAKFLLSRIYKLTQFDSGAYTIPRQKVIIGDQPFFTDSLRIEVNTIEVDTTKQKLYDIKPIIEVEKSGGNWWLWLLIVLVAVALVAFLLYWFIWRPKPLTEEEEIALLPPYDRAKLALKKLDESPYLIQSEVKTYYSELTLVIRKYLDEKVYDRSLESTTDELVARLQLLKEGNQFAFTKETLHNLETILKRADLVKFAKSAPESALIEMDRATIEKEIDNVKACLPEPTEEEKLLDQQYKEAQERKKKRKKIILTAVISVLLLVATFVGFGLKFGFKNVVDTLLGDDSKELLEGEWVESAYGYPPVYIETPQVLRRMPDSLPEELKGKFERSFFAYGGGEENITIGILTMRALTEEDQQEQEEAQKNVSQSIDLLLSEWEARNVKNIITKGEQYITPNAVEGIRTYGNADFPLPDSEDFRKMEYAIYSFATTDAIMHVTLVWDKNDTYVEEIKDRIIDSIELKSDEQAEAEQETQN